MTTASFGVSARTHMHNVDAIPFNLRTLSLIEQFERHCCLSDGDDFFFSVRFTFFTFFSRNIHSIAHDFDLFSCDFVVE